MDGPKSTAGILQHVLDNDAAALRTSTTSVTIDNVSIAVTLDEDDGDALIAAGMATSDLQTSGNNILDGILTELQDKATEAKQDDIISALSDIETNLSEILTEQAGLIPVLDEASSTVTYKGWAYPGTATSTAGWRILKCTISGTVTRATAADGNLNLDNVWDNRASLSYS